MITNNANWKTMSVGNVKISVRPQPKTPYAILRVASLIDAGKGLKMAVLNNALPREWEVDIEDTQNVRTGSKKGLSLPSGIANLNFVYTGRSFGVVSEVGDTLRAVTRNARIAAIVPEVMMPGDFVVFRYGAPGLAARFAGVLRAVPSGSGDAEII